MRSLRISGRDLSTMLESRPREISARESAASASSAALLPSSCWPSYTVLSAQVSCATLPINVQPISFIIEGIPLIIKICCLIISMFKLSIMGCPCSACSAPSALARALPLRLSPTPTVPSLTLLFVSCCYLCIYIYIYTYIHVYIYRERER